jgi:hypothetical protein
MSTGYQISEQDELHYVTFQIAPTISSRQGCPMRDGI